MYEKNKAARRPLVKKGGGRPPKDGFAKRKGERVERRDRGDGEERAARKAGVGKDGGRSKEKRSVKSHRRRRGQ